MSVPKNAGSKQCHRKAATTKAIQTVVFNARARPLRRRRHAQARGRPWTRGMAPLSRPRLSEILGW
jgi:hypothetical protein